MRGAGAVRRDGRWGGHIPQLGRRTDWETLPCELKGEGEGCGAVCQEGKGRDAMARYRYIGTRWTGSVRSAGACDGSC